MNTPASERMRLADLAKAVLDALMDRSGFDGWWEGVDEETRDEIIEAIGFAIDAALKKDA